MAVDNSEFVKSIQAAGDTIIPEEIRKSMQKACMLIKREAVEKCPVDMGQLRASIHYETQIYKDKVVGRIGSNLEYAPYVHQGTGIYAVDGNGRKKPWGYTAKAGKYKGFHWTWGQKPQPFLKNAVFNNRDQIEKLLGMPLEM